MTTLAEKQGAMYVRHMSEIAKARSLVYGMADKAADFDALLKDSTLLQPTHAGEKDNVRSLLASLNKTIDTLCKNRFAMAQVAGLRQK